MGPDPRTMGSPYICQNKGKPGMNQTIRNRILRDGVPGCCWSLSRALIRAHACTRCGEWAHSAFDCSVHVKDPPDPTIVPDDVQRALTGAHPSRFRDEQGNWPPGHRGKQREYYRGRDGWGR